MNAPITSLIPSTLAESAVAKVGLAAPQARLSLRARGDLDQLSAALGLTLPERIGRRARSGEIEALCLGPDEWVLRLPEARVGAIQSACAEVYGRMPHSLVDISGREVSFTIEGPAAAVLLTLGCPRDIDTIAVGEGCRTVFDGVTVVIWRDGADAFRLDCWHSFAPHVSELLEIGCRELAAEAR